MIKLYTDGSCRNNGRPNAVVGIGYVVYKGDKQYFKYSKRLEGYVTNNQTEYIAVLDGLNYVRDYFFTPYNKDLPVKVYSDSKLLVNQMNGVWGISNEGIKKLYFEIADLLEDMKDVEFIWISREQNKIADELAQQATKGS